MRFTSLASGSSGNCTSISSDTTSILVDAGISCKRITDGLNQLDLAAKDLDGILITHEHSDHICGLRVFSKKNHIPLYGTKETLEAIARLDTKHEIDPDLYRPVLPDDPVAIGDLVVTPFSNTHDAANPVGYRVDCGKKSAAVCTDLGNYSQYTISHLLHLDVLLLEANHDIRMLELGSYPYALKRRILSDYGHLCNEASGRLLSEVLHDDMRHIFLGHLSKENNYEQLAYEAVRLEVDRSDTPYSANDFSMSVAKRDVMSESIIF